MGSPLSAPPSSGAPTPHKQQSCQPQRTTRSFQVPALKAFPLAARPTFLQATSVPKVAANGTIFDCEGRLFHGKRFHLVQRVKPAVGPTAHESPTCTGFPASWRLVRASPGGANDANDATPRAGNRVACPGGSPRTWPLSDPRQARVPRGCPRCPCPPMGRRATRVRESSPSRAPPSRRG